MFFVSLDLPALIDGRAHDLHPSSRNLSLSRSPTRLFLVQPVDAEPLQLPEGAQVIQADSIETLQHAQTVTDALRLFVTGRMTFREIKVLLRSQLSS